MDTLIVFLLTLIAVLLIVLLVVLVKNKKDSKENELKDKEEFVNLLKEERFSNINITAITLPLEIESLSDTQLRDITRKILRIFESLDYKKNSNEYKSRSWHSWQVSMLLCLYKRDMELFIPNLEATFRDEIIDQSESTLDELVKNILNRYRREVKVHLSKETLSKNRIWSGKEVSILMCFLSKYKKIKG